MNAVDIYVMHWINSKVIGVDTYDSVINFIVDNCPCNYVGVVNNNVCSKQFQKDEIIWFV